MGSIDYSLSIVYGFLWGCVLYLAVHAYKQMQEDNEDDDPPFHTY
jgi:hypothetical protein